VALARLVTFVPLTLIKSADVNGEFNNILNNPIALISPTTGAINFSLVAHTNLVVTALSGTSGSTGNVLTLSTVGTPVWAAPSAVLSTTPRVLQMISGSAAGPVNAASTVMTDAGVSVTITPTSTNSRIAVLYSFSGIASNLAGVNNAYQAQLATSTGSLTGTVHQVENLTAAGGGGSISDIAWSLVYASTAAGPIGIKIQHMVTASSQGGASGSLTNFNGMLVEYSS
jgi:hypothetical protein